ncbi:MAG TPA: serine protease [Steroidobacteraceae bacterium]|nr:serine protease [Steroidobacteraceae bacterium]
MLVGGSALAQPPAGGGTVPKDVKLPVNVSLAIYLPAQLRRWHGPFSGLLGSSRTLEDTALSAGAIYFSESHMAEAGADAPYGLLLALHPDLKAESGHLVYTLNYAVFAADAQPLMKSSETVTVGGFDLDRATLQATQQVMTVLITGLHPDEHKYPAVLNLKSRSLDFAIDGDKPWSSGTGFYFNSSGQVLTAAHVIHDCIKIQVKRDDKVLSAKLLAASNVIDIAALDTSAPAASAPSASAPSASAPTAFLGFRRDTPIELGEPVTNVSFPLQSILAATPNLTRGNVSARGGLTGSEGQFQFSAPIQPGASGGPVVSDGGELLGVTVSTLNAAALAKQGTIPQNVNFALEARYVVRFLQKNGLAFTSVEPNLHGDAHTANQAALAAVVSVQCYE